MPLPDILDVFVLLGAGLMGWGAEQMAPGGGFVLSGAALYLVGLRGPAAPSAPAARPPGTGQPETR